MNSNGINNIILPDKIFVNLKILSKIEKNGRISKSLDGIIRLEKENFYQAIKRFLARDSRKKSLCEIKSIVDETIGFLYNILNSKFVSDEHNYTSNEFHNTFEIIELLVKSLNESKKGLENLKFTYSSDINITSQLDIIIMKISTTCKDVIYKMNSKNSSLKINLNDKSSDSEDSDTLKSY